MSNLKGVCVSFLLGLGVLVVSAQAETVIFGYSKDTAPISYFFSDGRSEEVKGFCGSLLAFLKEQYKIPQANLRMLETPGQRFESFASSLKKGEIGVQCGPSSRNKERESELTVEGKNGFHGEFSDPFFIAKTRLLIKKDKVKILYENPSSLRIGLLGGSEVTPTTTALAVKVFFPFSEINSKFLKRENAIKDLLSETVGSIDAYAADDVVLYDILNKEIKKEHKENDYVIVPDAGNGYSREEYVVVIYNAPRMGGAPSYLKSEIDHWIKDKERGGKAIRDALEENGIDSNRFLMADIPVESEKKSPPVTENDNGNDRGDILLYGFLLLSLLGAGYLLWPVVGSRARSVNSMAEMDGRLEHFSRDLHDKAMQPLISAKQSVNIALGNIQKDIDIVRVNLQYSLGSLDAGLEEVRRISHAMKGKERVQYDKIDKLLNDFEQANGISVSRNKNVNWQDLPAKHAENVYAILSEALANIQKHAEAKRVFVRLDKFGKRLELEIHDDGSGFEESRLSQAVGIGIQNMRERVRQLGGDFRINGVMGVRIQISIPC